MDEIVDGYCTPGTERETQLAPDSLLRMMDTAGIGRAVIAPEDREIAVDNVAGNDRILKLASQSGGRWIPACTVNPWFAGAGCRELQRAVGAGARMLVLAPALQGFCPTDELTDELLATAGELRVPVYVHTGPHSSGAPTQLALLAARFPHTRLILGHCGSTDYCHDMPAVLRAGPANLWFELSLVRPVAAATYVGLVDGSRLIFGSSAPRNNPAFELRQLNQHLPVASHPDIYGGNLRRLVAEVL